MGFLAKHKQRLLNVGAVIAVALMLLWPAFVNGEPFYMPDTSSYLRGADAVVYRLTRQSSAWTAEYLKRYSPTTEARVPEAVPALHSTEPPVVLAGRSIYYGLLLYCAQWLGNFWAVAALQALLVAVAISLTVATLAGQRSGGRKVKMTVMCGLLLAACTSAGFFASYMLPDVFGALALLAFGHLTFFWQQSGRPSRVFWLVTLVAAMLFHTSNFLLVGLLTATAIVFLLCRLPGSKVGLSVIVAALMISAAGQAFFNLSVRNATGAAPVRPPFLAARLIADGPGDGYLREHCPTVSLIFCRAVRFRTRISDTLLWSNDPNESIFQALTPAEQRLAAAQESGFVLAVARERPLEVLRSSIGAFFRQLTRFNLESFNYSAGNIAYFNRKIPSPFLGELQASKAYQNRMPIRVVEWMTLATVLASIVGIFGTLREMTTRTKRLPRSGAFLTFMILGVLLNAAICGAISTPKGRYQMRLIWVLPLAALASRKLRPWEPLESSGPRPNLAAVS